MAAVAPLRTNFNVNKNHSDIERWICIYPAYINNQKTRQEGRRLPKEQCVENPTYAEIRDVLIAGNAHVEVENKHYCREKSKEAIFCGRLRMQMRNDDGSPCFPELSSRELIMQYIAARIPQLKSRQNKPVDSHMNQQSTSRQAQQGGGSKKGKSKRR